PLARDQASELFSPTSDQVDQLMQDLNSLVLLEPLASVRQKTSCSRELALERHLVITGQTGDALAVKRLHDFNHERTSAPHIVRWIYTAPCPADAVGWPALLEGPAAPASYISDDALQTATAAFAPVRSLESVETSKRITARPTMSPRRRSSRFSLIS